MEELIAQYIEEDYFIKCESWQEIKLAKNAAVKCLGWSRTGGENMEFPYVGKESSTRVCGYRRPTSDKVISFTDLIAGAITEDEIGDIAEVL